VPLDESTAAEVRLILESLGAGPGGRFEAIFQPMSGPRDEKDAPRPGVGEPRELPSNWDQRWHRALDDWMAVENLEERSTALGWIDPRVLTILRERARTTP
jgi:Putative peptidoglycan binding domain